MRWPMGVPTGLSAVVDVRLERAAHEDVERERFHLILVREPSRSQHGTATVSPTPLLPCARPR
jgi:hypothetical protein